MANLIHLLGDGERTFCGMFVQDGAYVRSVTLDFRDITCGLCVKLVQHEIDTRRAERFPWYRRR